MNINFNICLSLTRKYDNWLMISSVLQVLMLYSGGFGGFDDAS